MPASALLIVQTLDGIVTLNAFNKNEVTDRIGLKSLSSSRLFSNLGGIALLVILVILFVILIVLLVKICKHPKIKNVLDKIKTILIWNFVIRYFYASYLNFCYSSFVTLSSSESSIEDKVVSAIILFVQICVNVLFIWKLYKFHYAALDHPKSRKKFGMLYAGLKTN